MFYITRWSWHNNRDIASVVIGNMFNHHRYIWLSVVGIITLFLIFLAYNGVLQAHKNAKDAVRVQNTKSRMNSFPLSFTVFAYMYDDISEALNKTTPFSLKTPTIASAKVLHYQPSQPKSARLLFEVVWIESMPSIDGIRIRCQSKNMDIRVNAYGEEDGPVLFSDKFIIFQDDSRWRELDEAWGDSFVSDTLRVNTSWEEWAAILDAMQTDVVYVSLLRHRRVVSKEHPLNKVPSSSFQKYFPEFFPENDLSPSSFNSESSTFDSEQVEHESLR